AFSASSRLFDLNGEANRVRKRKKSAIIAVDVRRFGHAINTDKVFGTHSRPFDKKDQRCQRRRECRGVGERARPWGQGAPIARQLTEDAPLSSQIDQPAPLLSS